MWKVTFPSFRSSKSVGPWLWTTALGSIVWPAFGGATGFRPFRSDTPTTMAKITTNNAIARRRRLRHMGSDRGRKTGRPEPLFYVAQALEVRDGQLEVGLALELVLVEGEREVDAGAMLGEKGGAVRGAPRDRAEAAAVLAEGHLEVPILERPRAVHDLDRHGVEDGPRVRHAEGGHQVEAVHEVGRDLLQVQRTIDAQARTQVIGLEHLVGVRVDA